jgi:Holliday junction resolvasome RuvABC endonuclease subunit
VIRVLGLDLSLTATGVAGLGWATTLKYPTKKSGQDPLTYSHQRLRWYHDTLADVYLRGVQLVVVEGLAFAHHNNGTAALAGQSWMIRDLLWRRSIPYAMVSPTALKLYATGRGNASKAEVGASVLHWWPGFDGDDNAADAAVLAAMGAHRLGVLLDATTQSQTMVLAGVTWPEVAALEAIA